MRRLNLCRFGLGFGVAAALLAASGVLPLSQSKGQDDMPLIGAPATSLGTMAHSFMQPDAVKKSALIYTGGRGGTYYDVYVYDYATGKQVGVLSGLDYPEGMCVDAKGDVYIANFGGGNVVEYAHGGTTVISTYNSGYSSKGCSVAAKGDLAVTLSYPGGVIIYAGGNPSKSRTYTSPCTEQTEMGYDDKGNLVGVGRIYYSAYSSNVVVCALLSGSKSMITLSGCCNGPITINEPGRTMWDGKYLALIDGEAAYSSYYGPSTGIVHATVSGTTLVSHGSETIPRDDCSSGYTAYPSFIVGKRNTPVNREQGKILAGFNLIQGCGGITFWHYPAGGLPFKRYATDPGGQAFAVSLKP
jgi:hypothetical protein